MLKKNCLPRLKKKQVLIASLCGASLFLMYQLAFFVVLSDEVSHRNRIHPKDLHSKKIGAIEHVKKNGFEAQVNPVMSVIQQTMENKYAPSSNISARSHIINKDNIANIRKSKLPAVTVLSLGLSQKDAMDSENAAKIVRISYTKSKELELATFKCQSSDLVITALQVNDDYCDCPEDGSDEPLTNACEKSHFRCLKQSRNFPSFIGSGFVNDGVCDCCDGSDEWAGRILPVTLGKDRQDAIGVHQTPCPNLCIT